MSKKSEFRIVGNGLRAVPRYAPKVPPHPGESAPTSHYSVIARPKARGNPHSLRCKAPPGPFGTGKRTDCHVASLLAMTWWLLPGPSIGGAVRPPREGWPYGCFFGKMKKCPQTLKTLWTNPGKQPLHRLNFLAKAQKTPQTRWEPVEFFVSVCTCSIQYAERKLATGRAVSARLMARISCRSYRP